MEQYNISVETLTFNIEGMSIEEIEEKLKESYNNDNVPDQNSEPEKIY